MNPLIADDNVERMNTLPTLDSVDKDQSGPVFNDGYSRKIRKIPTYK